jgi:hypothetical protein
VPSKNHEEEKCFVSRSRGRGYSRSSSSFEFVPALGERRAGHGELPKHCTISLGVHITEYAVENGIRVNPEPEEPNSDSLFKTE